MFFVTQLKDFLIEKELFGNKQQRKRTTAHGIHASAATAAMFNIRRYRQKTRGNLIFLCLHKKQVKWTKNILFAGPCFYAIWVYTWKWTFENNDANRLQPFGNRQASFHKYILQHRWNES